MRIIIHLIHNLSFAASNEDILPISLKMITFHVYLLSTLMATSSIFQHVAARSTEQVIAERRLQSVSEVPTQVPTNKPTKKPTYGGTQPPNLQLMQFNTTISKEDLVDSLISASGDVEFQDIQATSNFAQCAAMYTGGHTLGKLMQRGSAPDYTLLTDANGNYIPSDTYIAPDVGIILSSGDPRRYNWNDGDMDTVEHSTTQVTTSPWLTELRADDTNAQIRSTSNSFYDACAVSFKFRCMSNGYVPRVSFKYSFGSEEYYEYVHSQFNDAFGFYLNGQNIAKLPFSTTGSTLVAINNVNYEENKQYFNGNDPGQNAGRSGHPDSDIIYPHIEADGFTNILVAMGEPNPDPNAWNTMKLIVSDVGDAKLDSWVVLERESFTCVRYSDGELLRRDAGKSWCCSGLCLSFLIVMGCHGEWW